MTKAVSDKTFIDAFKRTGSPAAVAKLTGMDIRTVYRRRAQLAQKGVVLSTRASAGGPRSEYSVADGYLTRFNAEVRDGTVVVFNDAHYWPGQTSLAHKALVETIKQLKPKMVVANGDVFDGATISRHDPMGWQKLPTVVEELDAVKEHLWQIERAAGKAVLRKTVGNHDARFDRRLMMEVSQYEGVPGFRLEDHLKAWPMSYSVMLNEAAGHPLIIRHAMRGGIHAVYNNTLHAGISIVTGHLHAQLVRPFTDYRGTRYGVDPGCLADIHGPQFSYTMDGPVNWRSGFAVLTFDKIGALLPPELCEVQQIGKEKRAVFRGEVVCSEKIK